MLRLVLASLLLSCVARAAEPAPRPKIALRELAAPTAGDASGVSLARGADGAIWLSWLEKSPAGTALRVATFDAAAGRWRAPHTVASGADWFINSADFPALAVGPANRATAVWYVNNPPSATSTHAGHGAGYHARVSHTTDGGATWSPPAPLTRESAAVEFVALAALADGRVLAAWLDGRGRAAGGPQQLFARIVGSEGPDTLVDPSVCDCCQTSLTAFPDGTALLAYRGRDAQEVRDIRVTRFRRGAWEPPRPLNRDGWRIDGCPVNGPQLASDGGRVAAAWFTAADDEPRVLATLSPDAGARFLMPVSVHQAKPAGRVATALLHDGALLVAWVDVDGAAWLRRVSPEFSPADLVPLGPGGGRRVRGWPRLALLRDYEGDERPAQLLVAYPQDGAPGVRTVLVEVPEGALVEAEKNCDCPPSADQLKGYPVRGTLAAVSPAQGSARVQLHEVPGILEAGPHDLRATPQALAAAQAGRQFLGRIERREGAWWLTEVRLIATPAR